MLPIRGIIKDLFWGLIIDRLWSLATNRQSLITDREWINKRWERICFQETELISPGQDSRIKRIKLESAYSNWCEQNLLALKRSLNAAESLLLSSDSWIKNTFEFYYPLDRDLETLLLIDLQIERRKNLADNKKLIITSSVYYRRCPGHVSLSV